MHRTLPEPARPVRQRRRTTESTCISGGVARTIAVVRSRNSLSLAPTLGIDIHSPIPPANYGTELSQRVQCRAQDRHAIAPKRDRSDTHRRDRRARNRAREDKADGPDSHSSGNQGEQAVLNRPVVSCLENRGMPGIPHHRGPAGAQNGYGPLGSLARTRYNPGWEVPSLGSPQDRTKARCDLRRRC
jgi:hypothetical protein